ncbi:MAG TPA: ATP-binding cassette domain-containing protein [Stackebrandtia sp.]|jgi:ABC-2 type transport system ATP-binding protein|uniref:ABC transporter ATP-binding protein n=1 Tax=Stackebrandtia sp. TaxID=2023065 RepID=UPI002D5FD962|nr:ATP-binding cassette domain-containing protein [Stackebrandtia sp.]HZE38796.1 ATP-binding cassette domain-containing protein [Stackebrandtia sp.]
MIDVRHLTKRFRAKAAVDDLSFALKPGTVTGFLGPNGAGKTTTMRIILGLAAATSGDALVDGRPYRSRRRPMRDVGALLDASAVHPGRSARNHLRALAYTNRIPARRATEVLDQVGLSDVARKRVGSFSLGMKQRLGIAAALLGDPAVLMFDEPVNGLDPDGVRWIRELMRSLAAEGRTVFVSSHLMSEMQLTADRLIVIGRGKLLADTTVEELSARHDRGVLVRTPQHADLLAALDNTAATVTLGDDGALTVRGLDVAAIGDLAVARGIALHEVTRQRASLEDAYMALTAQSLEFHAPKEDAA